MPLSVVLRVKAVLLTPSVKCFPTLRHASFDAHELQRLHQAFTPIGSSFKVAFESRPEAEIRQLNSRRVELERALSNHENTTSSSGIQFEQAKEGVTALNRHSAASQPLADDSPADRVDEIRERLDEASPVKPRVLFSSLAINWRNWNRLFRYCRATRNSSNS